MGGASLGSKTASSLFHQMVGLASMAHAGLMRVTVVGSLKDQRNSPLWLPILVHTEMLDLE